ncbi:hypothetical protein AKJ40_04505 [candidate division MSBL1 archaeon SCGC-AAA259M10]|uniref:VOC domain-containing protein n=1 Tax=candidate division MSBL1 archaeon SCGC-AAA259M10 TaxID=1698270 RepID=A0A133UX37_9EURY|nr:hypothetical protein AKJ40_04505 [candidate division MSBL1 archaeon SCGC-AAA259M10]
MKATFHHVHLFSSDINKTIQFYQEMFGAKLLFDEEMAGSRNVMISIGNGKINFYDQPPTGEGKRIVHHLGIETDNLEALLDHMKSKGFKLKKKIKDLNTWKYVVVEGPDKILLELFQIVKKKESEKFYRKMSSL